MLIITGCNIGGTSTIKDYHVGTDGVKIVFFSSNLKEVYETDTIGRSLFIQNKGVYSLNNTRKGVLVVSYDEYYITLNTNQSPTPKIKVIDNLSGKGMNNPLGDEDYYEYVFNVAPLNELRSTVQTTIDYQLCYPYQTEVTIPTCIDTRKYTQDQSIPVCKQTTYTSSSGQGSPVAITKIIPEISMKGDVTRPQFSIYVENKGTGYVINNTGDDVCSGNNIAKRAGSLGTIHVNAVLSGRKLTCSPSDIVLKSGDNIARCFVSDDNLSFYNKTTRNYIAPLTVNLDYGYVNIEKETVTIKRLTDIRTDIQAKSCGYYEHSDGNKCISLCDYCKTNPTSADCIARRNAGNVSSSFKFDNNFGCVCSKSQCLSLSPTGQCIFGFCAGSDYCCNVDDCRDKEDNAACGGDQYVCRNHICLKNETQCQVQWSGNYTCSSKALCNSTTIQVGYCPPKTDPNIVCCIKK